MEEPVKAWGMNIKRSWGVFLFVLYNPHDWHWLGKALMIRFGLIGRIGIPVDAAATSFPDKALAVGDPHWSDNDTI
jgi:hypothetical protein